MLRIRNLCRKEESEQAIKRSGGEGGEGVKLELILEESEDETDTQAVEDNIAFKTKRTWSKKLSSNQISSYMKRRQNITGIPLMYNSTAYVLSCSLL